MKYFSFSGTSSRSEYWGVYVLSLVAGFMAGIFFAAFAAMDAVFLTLIALMAILALGVASVWVGLATGARRAREAGISPWWTAALLIPYLGFIVAIVLGCIPPGNATQA